MKKKILLLNKDVFNVLLLKKRSMSLPFELEVWFLPELKESIEDTLINNDFDLMISEVFGVDGFRIIKNLRSGAYGEKKISLPAIAYTTSVLGDDKRKCLEAGFDSYASIPDSNNFLVKEIARLLS